MTHAPASTAASVRLEGVGKAFLGSRGHVSALSSIDLAVEPGELVALVGQSGCGKSTLLRLVAGLELPTAGRVLVGGQPVRGPGPQCGIAFQEHRLLPWLTVRDNIAFGLPARPRLECERLVQQQIERMGLRGFEHAYPHQLSGGMAQRAALARALAPTPSILLLDEPFGALDAFTKTRLQEELLQAREQARPTTLLVTHDIEEAVFLADRIIVLSNRPGTIQRAFTVDLGRPRDRTSNAFSRCRRQVLREFGAAEAAPSEPAQLIPIHRGHALAGRTKEVS